MTVIENGTLEVEVTANAGVGTKLHIDNELFQQGLEALDGSKILQSIISFLDQQL